MKFRVCRRVAWALLCLFGGGVSLHAKGDPGAAQFHQNIQPLLKQYCYDCHGDGMSKGKVTFDQFKSDEAALQDRDLWFKALKNLRAGLMPPAKKPRPTAAEQEQIAHWIKYCVFDIDPENPDPGRVTLRRLNRAEYHNTIRDLLGVDFDAKFAFPPDDTGYGFDTIGDVLTMSPMLLEKYMIAAEDVVGQVVPVAPKVVARKKVWGGQFAGLGADEWNGASALSYYQPAAVSNVVKMKWAGAYRLGVDLVVNERYVDHIFDLNKCRLMFLVDGKELMRREFSWEGGKPYHFDFDQDWAAGKHELAFQLQPLTPNEPQTRKLSIQVSSVTINGPMAPEHWVAPDNYAKFFPQPVPAGASERRQYAKELLGGFARKAFRRPVDEKTIDRLADLAGGVYAQPGKTFESGIAEGMVAVLASPRFLFREEFTEPDRGGKGTYPLIDEYSLASRLSYFLWSSMPDEELFRLAGEGRLREQLPAQLERLLGDKRSEAFVRDFTGQWLRGRDIETVEIDSTSIMAREKKFDPERVRIRQRFHELADRAADSLTPPEKAELDGIRADFAKRFGKGKIDFNGELRHDMRKETEDVFDYVLRQDRSLLELIDSDYTFLNHRLALHYGLTNVEGDEMRRVVLPPDSPRGGVLTEGTVLAVTSNPTRTSPVKRGLFVLDSILGTPTPPPPPNTPPLEDAAKGDAAHKLSLREIMALHRQNPLCSSCHNRLDSLGLAFENFNAMGMWRKAEYGQPIDAAGSLITGESFAGVKDLKHILVAKHAADFYRTLTEKMLTYALGRGLEYYDVETVDRIVAQLQASNGRPSVLLTGIVDSAPFQKCRRTGTPATRGVALNLERP